MKYHAYKLNLSDEVVDAVNAAGTWGSTAESNAYMRLSFAQHNDEELPIKVMCAALMGLYQHGLTVEADNVEAVFAYDNSPVPTSGVEPVYHRSGLRSLSVGDLVSCGDGEETLFYVCCVSDWVKLPEDVNRALSTMTGPRLPAT